MKIGEEVDKVKAIVKIDMGSKRRTTDESICGNFSSIIELIMGGDMLFEVLIRLPVKVLFRFKVVSKQWYSTISEPSFARRYVARASLSPHTQQWILISCFARKPIVEQFFRKKLALRDCSLGMNCLDLLTVPQTTNAREFRDMLVGISNGLLLYGPAMEHLGEGQIYCYDIYNPMTGRWITLPPHQPSIPFVIFTGFVTQIKDYVLKSYRVLRINADYKSIHRSLRYEVYFSEIHEWVYYTADFSQDICFDGWENFVVIDKILHWIVKGYVMAVDLYNKPDSIRLISLPVDSGGGEGDELFGNLYNLFDEHQGHLRYFELQRGRSNEFSISLWKLIDYDMGEWFLQHRVIIDNFRCDGDRYIFLRPLSFHPFGCNIVYMQYLEKGHLRYFLSYDINARELKTVDETSKNCLFQIPNFLPLSLFVIPPWPVSVNSSPFEITTKD